MADAPSLPMGMPARRPKQLSVEDGRRLLTQYRLLKWKSQNSNHAALVSELQEKITSLEDAFADLTLEADEHREELAAESTAKELLESRLAAITAELTAERDTLAGAMASMAAEREAMSAALEWERREGAVPPRAAVDEDGDATRCVPRGGLGDPPSRVRDPPPGA